MRKKNGKIDGFISERKVGSVSTDMSELNRSGDMEITIGEYIMQMVLQKCHINYDWRSAFAYSFSGCTIYMTNSIFV